MLQKSSTLIGQLATVHNHDWLTKDKQIYKLSSIFFMSFTWFGLFYIYNITTKLCVPWSFYVFLIKSDLTTTYQPTTGQAVIWLLEFFFTFYWFGCYFRLALISYNRSQWKWKISVQVNLTLDICSDLNNPTGDNSPGFVRVSASNLRMPGFSQNFYRRPIRSFY